MPFEQLCGFQRLMRFIDLNSMDDVVAGKLFGSHRGEMELWLRVVLWLEP